MESLNITVTNTKQQYLFSRDVLGKVAGIFNIYQTHSSNPIYKYCIPKISFKEFDQISASSDVAITIQPAKHKFFFKRKDTQT